MLSVKKDRRVTVYLYIFLQSKSPRSSAKINTFCRWQIRSTRNIILITEI